MNSILVATDFSERSDRALRRATMLAKQTGATIALVHVIDDDQPYWIIETERKASARLLGEQATTLRDMDGVTCEAHVVVAAPFAGIVKATQTTAADLLVVGPHRRQVLLDVFIGTTAERTIRSVDCPVLMVNAPPVGAYQQMLLTTDLSPASGSAISTFASLGIAGRADLALLYVFHDPALGLSRAHTMLKDDENPAYRKALDTARRDLAGFVAALDRKPDVPMRQILRHENTRPAHEIQNAAREAAADLIVIGTQGRSGLRRLVLGSVAEEVLRDGRQDVLVIPPGALRRSETA
ncbi:MAG: universal stress protein [Burkholderiaceae bacterium]